MLEKLRALLKREDYSVAGMVPRLVNLERKLATAKTEAAEARDAASQARIARALGDESDAKELGPLDLRAQQAASEVEAVGSAIVLVARELVHAAADEAPGELARARALLAETKEKRLALFKRAGAALRLAAYYSYAAQGRPVPPDVRAVDDIRAVLLEADRLGPGLAAGFAVVPEQTERVDWGLENDALGELRQLESALQQKPVEGLLVPKIEGQVRPETLAAVRRFAAEVKAPVEPPAPRVVLSEAFTVCNVLDPRSFPNEAEARAYLKGVRERVHDKTIGQISVHRTGYERGEPFTESLTLDTPAGAGEGDGEAAGL